MTFTDERLESLKDFLQWTTSKDEGVKPEFVRALLARLEAAEKCIPYHECQDDLSTCPHLQAWRKAAGK